MSLDNFANSIGVASDGLRLVIGMSLVYPLFLLYNASSLKRCSARTQHAYFICTGVLLSYWTFGANCLLHHCVCILVNFICLKSFGANLYSTAFLFLFQLGYLYAGYVAYQTRDYQTNWTLPHCILCLRLIGVAIDVFDGAQSKELREKDQKLNALSEVPNLIEMTSHVFFLPSYFAGPQYSMKRFRDFILRNKNNGSLKGAKTFGTKRFALGYLYFIMHIIGSQIVPFDYVKTTEFQSMGVWKMNFYLVVWAKAILAKYIGAWLLADGCIIISGLGYNGHRKDGTILWDGCNNVNIWLYENCTNFGQLIESFNIGTNTWCRSYVYKRCRFLGNKMLSQVITLLFLAIWHGSHSGYYLTFFNETLVMTFEKQFFPIMGNSPLLQRLNQNYLFRKLAHCVGIFYVLFFLPHCFLPFALLKSDVYLDVLWATGAMVFLVFGSWPIWKHFLLILVKPMEQNGTKRSSNAVIKDSGQDIKKVMRKVA